MIAERTNVRRKEYEKLSKLLRVTQKFCQHVRATVCFCRNEGSTAQIWIYATCPGASWYDVISVQDIFHNFHSRKGCLEQLLYSSTASASTCGTLPPPGIFCHNNKHGVGKLRLLYMIPHDPPGQVRRQDRPGVVLAGAEPGALGVVRDNGGVATVSARLNVFIL